MDWGIRFGDLVVIVSLFATMLIYIFKFGGHAQTGLAMKQDIEELKVELKKIADILTQVAVQKVRLDAQTERLNLLDHRIEDMRNGRGFILSGQHSLPFGKEK